MTEEIEWALLAQKCKNYLEVDCNYNNVHFVDRKTYACIMPLIYTAAIITGDISEDADMTNRWCYHSATDAVIALLKWKELGFKGEPTGWHRHPGSGRRVDEAGKEYINP